MKKTLLFWVLFLSFYSNYYSENPIFKTPLSERIANYDISVKLDTSNHTLNGSEILYWKNTSDDEIQELQFHLYLNAFKNDKSTFMKESGSRHRGVSTKNKNWGWININSMKIVDGPDLTKLIEYYQPDDSNKNDQTVIRVPLPKPLQPREKLSVKIEFTSKLPNIFARTGYQNDYYLVGQWFPKIGVYEKAGERYAVQGQWNCHQFHANSEFYADFGVYNVGITVPENFIVGASGLLNYSKKNEDGTKFLHYHAEDIIDFVWTASPNFMIAEDSWEKIKIKVLLQPQHYYMANRFLKSAINAIKYLDKHVGKYPYSNLTIVDPPFNALASGGMEYPTFITTISLWGLPDYFKFVESTTIHEFTHNYFMGMLASNEFEEPWLDEGFTQYFETRIMDENYGKKTSEFNFLGYHVGDFESTRLSYVQMKNPTVSDNSPFAWQYPMFTYGVLSYNKTATWLATLERIIGRNVMDKVFQTYFEEWKFKHPCGKNFIDVADSVVKEKYGNKFGENLNWFFDQVLYGSGICDYKIASIRILDAEIKNDGSTNKDSLIEKSDAKLYNSEVIAYRVGEVKLPVEVLIHFADGKEKFVKWDGKNRFHKFEFKNKAKVVWAKVDPYRKILLDMNLQNNSLTTKPETSVINKYTVKVLFWLENVMLSFGTLF